jgi:hypothetical protein
MKGYTPDEIIGRHFSQFFTGEDRDAGLPQKKRFTCTTFNPYHPDSPLLESGLMGPVTLQAAGRAGSPEP